MDESAHTQPNNTTMISSQNHEEVQLQNGIGRITSSGTTVQGHYTEFMKQLSVGDAIIITHPTRYVCVYMTPNLQQEMLYSKAQFAGRNKSCEDGPVECQYWHQFSVLH